VAFFSKRDFPATAWLLVKLRRRPSRITLTILAAFAMLTVSVFMLSAHIFQYRAMALHKEVQDFRIGETRFSDTAAFRKKYGHNLSKDCSCPGTCTYSVILTRGEYLGDLQEPPWFGLVLDRFGARYASFRASLIFKDGILAGKSLSLAVGVNANWALVASSRSTPDFELNADNPRLEKHPNHLVGSPGGCSGCKAVYAYYTPEADPREMELASDIRFSCIAGLKRCTTFSDIMPTAALEHARESGSRTDSPEVSKCSADRLQRFARDFPNIYVIRLLETGTGTSDEKQRDELIAFRIERVLKGEAEEFRLWRSHLLQEFSAGPASSSAWNSRMPRRLIVFRHRYGPPRSRCSLLPADEQTLELIKTVVRRPPSKAVAMCPRG
jgi:hypothetical protein